MRSRARGDRSRRVARSLVLLAAALTASLAALALPGSVSRDEAAVYRALVTNETVVIETRKPRQPACPDGSAAAACPVPSELAARFAEANLRRGYVDCHQLQLDYKRCVRWRQTRRPMFYGFPALVLSRPGISADGKSAVVYRELHKTASRGVRGWVLLARDVPDGAWRVVREHASVRF